MGSLRTALDGVVGRFASDRPNGKERLHKTRLLIRQLRVSLDYAGYGQAILLRARHAADAPPSSVMNSRRFIFASFDHLVGAGEQRRRHVEAECFRRPQIDQKFNDGDPLD